MHHVVLKMALGMLIAGIYMAVLFRNWNTTDELMSYTLPFILVSIFTGIGLSLVPGSRKYLQTFLMTAPAPLLCFLFYTSVDWLIGSAHASGTGVMAGLGYAAVIVFLAGIGVIFGIFAVVGCYLGTSLRRKLTDFVEHSTLTRIDVDPVAASTRAAWVGAAATVLTGFVGSISGIIIALV